MAIKVVLILFATMLIAQFINQCYNPSGMRPAHIANTRTTVDSLCMALEQYKNDMGQFPATNDSRLVMNELTGYKDSVDAIDFMYSTNALWDGPYYIAKKPKFKSRMMNEALLDPWKSPYSFDFSDNKPKIWSWGRNRKNEHGMGDDITNWK